MDMEHTPLAASLRAAHNRPNVDCFAATLQKKTGASLAGCAPGGNREEGNLDN